MALLDTASKKIILASKSPRRIELLKKVITHFDNCVSDIDENIIDEAEPARIAIELSNKKAEQVAAKMGNCIIIGADSIVVVGEKILGKPKKFQESFEMLNLLSGKEHQVYTGFSIINKTENFNYSDVEITRVKFRELESREIEKYIKTNEPFDKAGSYGIQDDASVFVEYIHGCYYNVMGLPVSRIYGVLKQILTND